LNGREMALFSSRFPVLLEVCMRHLLVKNVAPCAAIASEVLSLCPNEKIFQIILATAKRAPVAESACDEGHQALEGSSQQALEEACASLESSIQTAPEEHALYRRLAHVYECLGQHREAAWMYVLCATSAPRSVSAHEGLLRCYLYLRAVAEVLQAVQQCVRLASADGEWLARLAKALISIDQRERAKDLCLQALGNLDEPARVPVYLTLGELEKECEKYDASEEWFRRALQVSPLDYSIQREVFGVLLSAGRTVSAKKAVDEFFAHNPKSLSLFFLKVSLELQPVYTSPEHVAQARAAVVEGLRIIKETLPTMPERMVPVLEHILDNLNFLFYLPYQGQSVVAVQRTVAEICYDAMQRFMPLPPLEPRAPLVGRKIRLGIASGFFRDHSNYKIPIKGWMKELDRDSFETFGYHFSSRIDAKTEEATAYFDHFEQRERSLREWIDTIRADKLDVLIFPEVGMDPMTRKVACFRLAPVQVNSWGHPVTSGLPTMDYFLSSDLMEGPQADKEYTEKLIRLPLLSINYEPPKRTLLPLSRATIGIREESTAYWCCQVIYKQLPQFDWVYPEIAARVPNSQFVFITIQPNSETALVFKQRLQRAFEAKGLSAEKHLLFLSGLKGDEFATCASLCDLSLDSFEWSGCNSSLETLAQGVPVISCPGSFMRGRHTEAILRVMRCEELIASNPTDYIELAVSLSSDLARRKAISKKVRENIHLAYGDTSCVRELEGYLKEWAQAAISAGSL
jgi:protein O-GlcNAc transferase